MMRSLRNQRGILTVDFMFSIVLVLGFASLMFVLSFTLSVASVTQYVTFTAARNFAAAHIDRSSQEERAQAKYSELVNHPVLKPLYNNGWYTVDEKATLGDQTQVVEAFAGGNDGVNEFWGAGTNFIARVLDFQIPFFGSTVPENSGTGKDKGNGFKTYLSSNLGREPTTAECLEFTAARWTAIRNLPVTGGAAYSTGTPTTGYFPMTDDGC